MSVPYEIPWRKGSYLARLEGPSGDKYGMIREWETGTPVKGRGVLSYALAPGWYEYRGNYGAGKVYVAVSELGAREIQSDTAIANMDRISGGPVPETDGAWGYDRCLCGAEVSDFDEVGFPYCSSHVPEPAEASALPVPA